MSALARLVILASALVALVSVVLYALLFEFGWFVPIYASALVYVGVGALLTWNRPEHPVGWLLLIFGVGLEISGALGAYAWQALVRSPGSLPFGTTALLANAFVGVPTVVSLFFAVLLFPTGRLPSPRWRLAAGALIGWGILSLAKGLFGQELVVPAETPRSFLMSVPNPFALGGQVGALLASASESKLFAIIPLVLAAAVIARLRGARGIERQQVKMFAYAGAIATALPLAIGSELVKLGALTPVATAVVLDLMAVSVAIAILRYRLYEIDVVIERTIVYGAVTAALGATYLGSVIGAQALLGPITAGNEVAVAASTLLVVALFQPFRTRIRKAVDRRFYRARYDAQRTLDSFGARLGDEVDLDMLQHDLLGVVDDTMRPSRISLWLRKPNLQGPKA